MLEQDFVRICCTGSLDWLDEPTTRKIMEKARQIYDEEIYFEVIRGFKVVNGVGYNLVARELIEWSEV